MSEQSRATGMAARLAQRPFWVVTATACLMLLSWGIALYSITSQIDQPFPGFFYNPQRVVSSFTLPGFSGPVAGLQPRDVILAVDGQHWRELPRLVRETAVGETLVYTVARGGAQLDIPVPTMRFSADIITQFLPGYIISSLIFLAIGVFIYRRNPAGSLNRYLLVYLLVWALGGAVVWEAYVSPHKWMAFLLLPYAVVAPVAGWIFFWTFPDEPTWQRSAGRFSAVRAFVLLAIGTIVVMTGLHLAALLLDEPVIWRALVFLQTWPYFIIFGFGSLPIKSLPLLVILFRQPDRLRRQQAAVMLAGLLVGLGGWYLFLWAPAAIHIPPVAGAQWGGLVAAAYPLSIGYAALRYRLLDIRVVIRKGLVYSLLTAILTATFLVISLLGGFFFQNLTGRSSLLAMIVAALFVAAFFQPAQSRIQEVVDRLFFKREVAVRQTLTQFSHSLNKLRSQSEIAQLLRDTLAVTLGARNAALWVLDGSHYRPLPAGTDGGAGFAAGGPLAVWLAQERRPLLLPTSDAALSLAGAVLAIPLYAGGRMAAILTLGEKGSGDDYHQEDLDLLAMLADSTALALDNARLHEEQVALVRQQFIQAAAIQEEERHRIARELHDGVGSSLAGLNIRLHRVSKHLDRDHNAMAGEVKELAAETQTSIHDIRRLVYDLRPVALDELGLFSALQEFAARYQIDYGLHVRLSLPEHLGRLPVAVETTLFRIAQESLANVARHAHAQHVDLRLSSSPAGVSLEIVDDGQGFQQPVAPAGDHTGLWSMQKRVEQFGGCFVIESAPGRGTCVSVQIPLHEP
jgi:signal transduction histidine kinase